MLKSENRYTEKGEKAIECAKSFTWEKTAREIPEVYKNDEWVSLYESLNDRT